MHLVSVAICSDVMFRVATVGLLQGEAKERYNEIQQELSKLSTTFSNNIQDGTKAFRKLITAKADVEGLPASALGLAAQQVSFISCTAGTDPKFAESHGCMDHALQKVCLKRILDAYHDVLLP